MRLSLLRSVQVSLILVAAASLPCAQADSATWSLNPTSDDWNTAGNWTPNTVPNGTDDIATFSVSNVTEIAQSKNTALASMQFEPGSSSYSITLLPHNNFSLNDTGVTNQSSVAQSINCFSTALDFYNESTAGENVIYTCTNAGSSAQIVTFHDNATAGGATFINNYNTASLQNSAIEFVENASAGTSVITNDGNCCTGFGATAMTNFFDDSTAAESTITYDSVATGVFASQATAANSTITCSANSSILFLDNSTAGAATIKASADAKIFFQDFSSAGAATLTADGSSLTFQEQSDGDSARVVLSNASILLADHERRGPVFHLGSLEGNGTATINRVLVIGGNDLNATFSGNLESSVEGDWLTKVGNGTWTLAGAGAYAGTTTVTAGALLVTSNSTPTGSGPVKVNGGTLGGSGTIAGSVTIGSGSGTGAFLAPAYGGNKQLTLTIQGSLTFNSDSTYIYTFKAKGSRSTIDKVIASGITINSGAAIALSGIAQGQLTQGMTLTVIKNTAAAEINGTFSNLPDRAIVNVSGNNFQANYEGGDGNDLTLTVVP